MSTEQVYHDKYGQGSVLVDNGSTLVVRFIHGIEEVGHEAIQKRASVDQSIETDTVAPPVDAALRTLSASIRSVNDSWGVFSRSRIDLLPHQLWVCNKALRDWPIRMLVADDVGLGKTIEAGLILWPLLSSGAVKRLLILTPASLVSQWQDRLRNMFDIRMAIYNSAVDTDRIDFWNTHNQVVASLPTIRADNNDRHERLLLADDWDLVIVDEAHHLNVDEGKSKTQGFLLLEKLMDKKKVTSCIFFTGTPHRGKPYGFWSLLSLLRADFFDPNKSEDQQLPHLKDVLIRNLKQKVTDMEGNLLFKPIQQSPETYAYSEEEKHFYDLMTMFISSGQAYALSLSGQRRSRVMLVLISLQKLASSSVAAVRSALRTRRDRMQGLAVNFRQQCKELEPEKDTGSGEETGGLNAWLEAKGGLQLTENEVENLNMLIEAADAVQVETRVTKIINVVSGRFDGEPVLLFTEYKATQALIVSALMARYGEGSVEFINGDDTLSNVQLPSGERGQLHSNRHDAADKFNSGRVRFLVSTEAGGEGIDLQELCHCLIHADLPWNPMRLHQRVGRLNRYGQKHPVQVVSLRNPDTVESKIWDKLDEKLHHIMKALGSAMDEPEDLLQLVLGMSDQAFFNELFSKAAKNGGKGFDKWFDKKTKNLGDKDAISTVNSLVGNAQGFDLSGLKDVPAVDLPDLSPFFASMLAYNKRRPHIENGQYTFKTPDEWLNTPAVKRRYESLIFERNVKERGIAQRVVGVGHQVLDQALDQADSFAGAMSVINDLEYSIAVFSVQDSRTDEGGQVRQVIVAARVKDGMAILMKDWELIQILNPFLKLLPREAVSTEQNVAKRREMMGLALIEVNDKLPTLNLPFKQPRVTSFQLFLNS